MSHSYPTRYASTLALAELPWFERRGEGLALVDESVGPIIDVHTHLALTYLRRRSVDLHAAPGPTRHYLSRKAPLDLCVYQNKNLDAAALMAMKRDLSLGSLTRGGMRETHTVPNLLSEMAALGIARSLLLPIDFPVLSHNAESWLEIAAGEPRLSSLGSVHPHHRRAADELAEQKRHGALGVKLHPAVQLVPADHPRAMALYPRCGDLGLPVLWHCGPVGIEPKRGRRASQLKHYWRAVHEHPGTTFVLGHSGALQMEMALTLCQQYPNVYLEIACQGLDEVRRIIAEAPIERVMYGSDWPFYHQAIGVAKVLMATEGLAAERALVLRDNAVRLFGLPAPAGG